jgi:hypothetical protein
MLDLLWRALVSFDLDVLRIVQEESGQRTDSFGHRRGEEMGLTFARQEARDFLHVWPEPEGQHLVRFVEHEDLRLAEIHSAVLEMVQDSTWRADHDMGALFEAFELGAVGDSAVDGQRVDAPVLTELVEFFGDLIGELSRRQQHDRLGLGDRRFDRLDERDSEGTGLSATGLRLNDQVASGSHFRDRGGLDGRRCMPPEVTDGLLDIGCYIGEKFREFSHMARARYPSRGEGATSCRCCRSC